MQLNGPSLIMQAMRGLKKQARRRPRSYRDIDAARARSLRPRHSRQDQQAGRQRAGRHRTDDQGPSPPGDGENAGPIPGGACFSCRARRRFRRSVRGPTDGVAVYRQRLRSIVRWDNRKCVQVRIPRQQGDVGKPIVPSAGLTGLSWFPAASQRSSATPSVTQPKDIVRETKYRFCRR